MKGKKIIITLIIIIILLLGIICNFIKRDYLNNEKLLLKAMTDVEYEDDITNLNQSHTDYANYIQESKAQIASAITEMGVTTSADETLESMANNIKSIDVKKGGLITYTVPNVAAGGTYTFEIPEAGEYTLSVFSGRGWGCSILSITSTTIENYTIQEEYHTDATGTAYAYMILNIEAKSGDTITFLHGDPNGYNTTSMYTLISR